MARTLLDRNAIQFDFVSYVDHMDPAALPGNRLYLDAGNALGPGVIDHHHLPAYVGSTAGLVLRHPELVSESIGANRHRDDPFTIFVHVYPDLDCLVSVWLAICILADGQLPRSAPALAKYVDHVDAGHSGFTQERPFALYAAYLLLMHDLGAAGPSGWRECLTRGLDVVGHVDAKTSAGGESVFDVDAFACERIFKPRDRRELENDLTRYRDKLNDPHSACRSLQLQLQGEFGGIKTVDALLARHVQDVDDPDRCIYFKDWARSDRENSSSGRGFVALSVFISDRCDRDQVQPTGHGQATEIAPPMHRCILSVAPVSGVSLRGLGELLEQAETQTRIELLGADDRVVDPRSGNRLASRPGYSNADPWYDGRGHNYTIVDSPRIGTLLSADRIEEIFIEFGKRDSGPTALVGLPAPGDETGSASQPARPSDLHALSRMTSLVDHWRQDHHPQAPAQPLDVFISYSRTCAEWVEHHVTKPLSEARGSDVVFFDKHHLNAGMGWLSTLADAVMNCRLFLPIYCPAYFRSDFCQWELQLALTRDPTGRKRIVTPIMLETTPLPAYCCLIQAQVNVDADISHRVVALANELLGIQAGKTGTDPVS